MSRHSKQNTAVFSQKRADICSKMSRHIKQKAAESPFSRPQAAFFSPKRTKKSTKAKRRKETPLPETTTKSNEKRSTEKHFPEKGTTVRQPDRIAIHLPAFFPASPTSGRKQRILIRRKQHFVRMSIPPKERRKTPARQSGEQLVKYATFSITIIMPGDNGQTDNGLQLRNYFIYQFPK